MGIRYGRHTVTLVTEWSRDWSKLTGQARFLRTKGTKDPRGYAGLSDGLDWLDHW